VRHRDGIRIFFAEKLIQRIIGVGDITAIRVGDLRDITGGIILIADGFAVVDIMLDSRIGRAVGIAPFSGGRRGPPLHGWYDHLYYRHISSRRQDDKPTTKEVVRIAPYNLFVGGLRFKMF